MCGAAVGWHIVGALLSFGDNTLLAARFLPGLFFRIARGNAPFSSQASDADAIWVR
jgi:hypothetical protein